MNARDYKEIMESEGLVLPEAGKYTLERAKWCQNVIRGLKKQGGMEAQIRELEEQKTGWIISAIEWAEMAKNMPEVFRPMDNLIRRAERRVRREGN